MLVFNLPGKYSQRSNEAVIACTWQSLTHMETTCKSGREERQTAGEEKMKAEEHNKSCLVCRHPSRFHSLEAERHQHSTGGKQSPSDVEGNLVSLLSVVVRFNPSLLQSADVLSLCSPAV